MQLDYYHKFQKCIENLEIKGNDYATAKSNSWYQQEMKGSILASIMNGLEGLPVSQKEIQAKASPDYKQFLSETAEAIKKELMARSAYEKEKSIFEAIRSMSSLEKKLIEKSE